MARLVSSFVWTVAVALAACGDDGADVGSDGTSSGFGSTGDEIDGASEGTSGARGGSTSLDATTADGGTTDGGSSDDGTTDGGSTDEGGTTHVGTDGGSTEEGSTEEGSTEEGSTDGGSTDGGSTDEGSTGAGTESGSSDDGTTGDEEIEVPCYEPELWANADPGPWVASVHPPCEDQSITEPSLSNDGRYVAYLTFGSPDAPTPLQIAVKDNADGDVVIVPLDESSIPTALPGRIVLSSDASTVTFRAVVDGEHSLWAYDLGTDTFEELHVIDDGILGNSYSDVTTSADGQIVAWQQFVQPEGAAGPFMGVMMHDRATSTTTYISNPANPAPPGGSNGASVSDDGTSVVFSHVEGLIDGIGGNQIYEYDVATGDVGIAVGDDPIGASFRNPVASADASIIAFETLEDLVATDTDNDSDVYVYDRDLDVFELVSVTDFGDGGGFGFVDPRISGDGEVVVFHFFDPGEPFQVFSRDRVLGQTHQLSLAGDGSALDDYAFGTLSLDGAWVAIETGATNFLDGGTLSMMYRAYMMLAVP